MQQYAQEIVVKTTKPGSISVQLYDGSEIIPIPGSWEIWQKDGIDYITDADGRVICRMRAYKEASENVANTYLVAMVPVLIEVIANLLNSVLTKTFSPSATALMGDAISHAQETIAQVKTVKIKEISCLR